MKDFATTQDLESFWRVLTDKEEKTRANALIKHASAYLRQVAKNNQIDLAEKIDLDTDNIYGDSVKLVILAAVKRAMLTPQEAPPADQWSQSASPYSETMTFTNPSNDLYFKAAELQLIGLSSISGRSKLGFIRGVRGSIEECEWGDES